MSYLQIKFRGGGQVIRADGWLLDMKTEETDDGETRLTLIRPSAIEGIWSYLLGNTLPVVTCADADAKELAQKSTVKLVSVPFGSGFFARKDFHSKKANYPTNPSVSLSGLSIDKADPSVLLLKDALVDLVGSSDLGVINRFFADGKRVPKEALAENGGELPGISRLPDGVKYVEKMKDYLNSDQLNLSCLRLIGKVNQLCAESTAFAEGLKNATVSKFSVFTSPDQTKQWIPAKSAPLVRGGPQIMVCIDFDIYINTPSQDVVERLKKGPFVARWGEGGFGVLSIMPYDTMPLEVSTETCDSSVSLADLRRCGVKLKKTDWEKAQKE